LFAFVASGLFVVMAHGQTTTTPAARGGWWPKRHQEKLALVKQGKFDLVFIGDSITHGFEMGGAAMWTKHFASRKALNLGFSGDKTENVLWRLDHGALDGQSPKLVVLMIGTNNTGHKDKPADIAAGVNAILDRLKAKVPTAKVLVLAIFPRSAGKNDPMRVNNDQANALIAKFADNRRVFFLDINNRFLTANGTLTKDIMPDLLHPNAKGYQIWAEAIEPTVAKLMGGTSRK
jgi:beta-glucosidase